MHLRAAVASCHGWASHVPSTNAADALNIRLRLTSKCRPYGTNRSLGLIPAPVTQSAATSTVRGQVDQRHTLHRIVRRQRFLDQRQCWVNFCANKLSQLADGEFAGLPMFIGPVWVHSSGGSCLRSTHSRSRTIGSESHPIERQGFTLRACTMKLLTTRPSSGNIRGP